MSTVVQADRIIVLDHGQGVSTLYAHNQENKVKEVVITSQDIRRVPSAVPKEGMGVVEAPRGTLFHEYETDEAGIIRKANMIVATQNNAARIAMSVEKAAKDLIKAGNVSEGLLNKIEMAFRAYDPCFGCATHTLPGQMPLEVNVREAKGGANPAAVAVTITPESLEKFRKEGNLKLALITRYPIDK